MFQPLLDAFIESAPIKKKLPLNLPPPKNRCGELVGRC
ncbi:1,3-fucosyltransferase [Helicobacter pylori PZ5004]|nr:1,3-fucosyltransferase [Helicobacter pylori PZ5004]